MIHFATNGRRTACGASTQDVVHSDEADQVAGCLDCLDAAGAPLACPGGCGDALACSCYLDGYNAGLAAAIAALGKAVS